MYAIIQARGRQLKVSPGAVVEIDGTPGETGSEFTFDQVLLVEKDAGEVLAGAPFVANARVVGVVDGEARGKKLLVFKKNGCLFDLRYSASPAGFSAGRAAFEQVLAGFRFPL